jgi:hypothetical protein
MSFVMPVRRIDPLHDSRWEEFLAGQTEASLFHTPGWLRALHLTYGYEPLAFTTSPPNTPLSNGIVFCRVKSFLTGMRLVSVPFADHCQPLVSSPDELQDLIAGVEQTVRSESCKYFELRCFSSGNAIVEHNTEVAKSASFAYHAIDLRPELDVLFRRFHKSCTQRKIRRALRERLVYEEGQSDELIRQFYELFVMMRRRHGVPPPPRAWFVNLRNALGSALKIRVIAKEGQPIASIVTVRHKARLVYKYGGSDARFHSLGAMPLLFWRTVEDAKELGLEELDLGRSDLDDKGLIAFKDHLGAIRSTVDYYRYPPRSARRSIVSEALFAPRLYAHCPTPLLSAVGKFLYRHVG